MTGAKTRSEIGTEDGPGAKTGAKPGANDWPEAKTGAKVMAKAGLIIRIKARNGAKS